ncbi:MAG: cobyrinate a,c-diamide synthase [Pseudomonadota bacterium]
MAQINNLPRLVIAGLAGDTGKSLLSLGLIRALKERGVRVAPFKKGPDFIDSAWLGKAAGLPGRNLDTFLMPRKSVLFSVARACEYADIAVVEGNRGLFDGMDAAGTHSTAQLAKLMNAPVVLVVDATKVTRTVAALVLGCKTMDPELRLAGVVLNRVATSRQEKVIVDAVKATVGIPVLGAIPRLLEQHLPSRHLGLLTAAEHPRVEEVLEKISREIEEYVGVSALLDLARSAGSLTLAEKPELPQKAKTRVRIGVLRDKAFSFYYPENLTALEEAGAELVEVSPLRDQEFPVVDALYAGGGFPEVHAEELAANGPMKKSIARRIGEGMPVWAECGGLMYLSQGVEQEGRQHKMVGVLPMVVEQTARPQGHGYVKARVDAMNPFLSEGTVLCGHEFHYSRLKTDGTNLVTMMALERGAGTGNGRDGIRTKNVVASYTHLHAFGAPEWAPGLVRAALGEGA